MIRFIKSWLYPGRHRADELFTPEWIPRQWCDVPECRVRGGHIHA